jgi:hypothetical protein
MMKRLIRQIIAISFFIGISGLFLVNEPFAWIKGLFFGTIISILRLFLIEATIKKAIKMSPAKASRYASSQYFIRYFLTAIVLIVAALEPSINLIATIIGLFTIKLSVYLTLITDKKGSNNSKH